MQKDSLEIFSVTVKTSYMKDTVEEKYFLESIQIFQENNKRKENDFFAWDFHFFKTNLRISVKMK